MSNPTVYAVMKCSIAIPVRCSSTGETIQQMFDASKREAEGILRNKLPPEFTVNGPIEFAYATIK